MRREGLTTTYKGTEFRSRTEARWAVFFDALGIAWRYEPCVVEFPSGDRYVPDFQLPDLKLWVEVKPPINGLAALERTRAERVVAGLARATSQQAVIFFGWPSDCAGARRSMSQSYNPGEEAHVSRIFWGSGLTGAGGDLGDHDYLWCACSECGRIGLEFEGRQERVCVQKVEDRRGVQEETLSVWEGVWSVRRCKPVAEDGAAKIARAARVARTWRFA